MANHFRIVRSERRCDRPLVAVALLIAAALLVGVGHIKSASIERAYRNTQYSAASVVSVGTNRIASVRYVWAGKIRTGHVDVSTATGVDSGDRLALRVSDGGRRLQLETPFYGGVYEWTAAGLALIALAIVMSSWRSSAGLGRQRKQWLPAELTRPRRHQRVR
jgi:hypothetical protein